MNSNYFVVALRGEDDSNWGTGLGSYHAIAVREPPNFLREGVRLVVNYTPRVNITVRNSFGGGIVRADGQDVTSGTPFLWNSGSYHSLQSFTQSWNGQNYTTANTWTNETSGQTFGQNPLSIYPTSDATYRANFSGATVTVEVVNSFGAGLVRVDQDDYPSGTEFEWTTGTVHTLQALAQEYQNYDRVFRRWEPPNGPPTTQNPWQISPTQTGTYTARLDRQFDINLNAASYVEPGSGGEYEVNSTNEGSDWQGNFIENVSQPIDMEAIPPANWIFSKWSDGYDVNFRSLTPIDHTTLSVSLKKHLATTESAQARAGGQRKVVNLGTASHSVYESGNSIWYSKNQSGSWTDEIQLSSPEIGVAKNPSIAVTYVAPYVHVHVVWEQTLEDIGGQPFQAVVYMRSTNGGSSWQSSWLSDTDFGTWGAYGEDATPVVAGSGTNVVVVWKYDDFYGAGLAWKANPIDWQAAPTGQIRYTDDSRKNPSLDGQTSFKLAYVMSGKIWFDEFNLSTNCGPTWCDAVYVGGGPADLSSEYSWISDCTNPSVTSNSGNPIFVSWDANSIPAGGTPPISYRNVFVREKVSGVWQPVREFGSTVEDINASVGVDPRTGYQKVNVLWQKPTAIAKVSRNISGGSWSSVSSLGAGYSPTVTGINLNGLPPWGMWTTGGAAPYGITLSDIGGAPPAMISELKGGTLDMGGDVIVTRRASVRLDSLRISGFESGSITGNLILESPQFEIIASGQRTPLNFVQDTVEFSDWMGTSTAVVSGNADSVAGNMRLILQNFRVADPRVPLGTPVLTVVASVNGNHLNLRLITLGDLVALGRSDTTLDYSHRVQARTLRNKTIQVQQVIIGQSAFQEPAWSEKWWSEDEELNVLALGSQSNIEEAERPSSYALFQNYPNPFNPMTTIKYALPSDGHVSLKLYDVLGKEIIDLIDAFESAGYHEVVLDANNIASGIYFYKLSAGSFSDVRKLAVVK